jgi:NADP-dependent 3-hydroxy acid dehydrogenase YdfG
VADITSGAAISSLISEVGASGVSVDLLVHAAGGISHGPLAEFPTDQLRTLFETNLIAPYALTQRLLPYLRSGSTVVFVNSSQGRRATAGQSPFSATQHALRAVADALRAEVNARGIRVTSIFPGRTATPRQEALYAERGDTYRPEDLLQAKDLAELLVAVATLPPTAEVTELDIRPAIKSY